METGISIRMCQLVRDPLVCCIICMHNFSIFICYRVQRLRLVIWRQRSCTLFHVPFSRLHDLGGWDSRRSRH
ncbi:unnamed protein product [Coffea canephora]|uniref:Uncharacterized protein n=1 Tax=Coffea canephora TaxID=49390 RepID=A0A068U4N8_COFCA|nr:unnamed protein product [Coffea canephora]